MDDTPDLDRLTLLERAQLLHDATLRRHSAMFDQQADSLARHDATMTALREIQERQQQMLETLTSLVTTQQTSLDSVQRDTQRHADILALLAHIAAQHEERMSTLQQTLAAIKDMLDRGNGH
jgi:hypothetical protein